MSTTASVASVNVGGKSTAQILEEAKTRHQRLADRRQRVQVELEAAARQLEEAQDEAEREFGTRDLEALRELYAQREKENEQKVQEFVANLDELETALNEVEGQLAT